MRIYLFVLLLLAIFSFPTDNKGKDQGPGQKKRKKFNIDFYECIKKSEEASEELQKLVEDNKDGLLRKALHENESKFGEKDQNAIKQCRRESFMKFRESIQKTFDEISSGKKIVQ